MSTNRQITIEDVGPITKMVLPVPEQGGVVVLRGRNGLGKSTALRAIDAALSGRGRIEHRDGAVGGTVNAFGIKVKAMRNQTRSGELEVESLEGRFSILDLVDPKIKEPAAADNRRIKALVQLQGARPDASLFYELVGGQKNFTDLISTKAMSEDDLVTMAGAIKRDLEAKARELKDQADKAFIAAQSARSAIEGIDLTQPDDPKQLADDHLLCVQELERLKAERKAVEEASRKLANARESISSMTEQYTGPSIVDAEKALAECRQKTEASQGILAQAEEAVRVARETHALNQLEEQHAARALKVAEQHALVMQQLQKDLGIEVPETTVTDQQIIDAQADVDAALLAIQTGTLIRDAKKRVREANAYAEQAADLHTKADAMTEAARGTDVVLSEVVQRLGGQLRVSHGRLVTATDRSENELFADLSRGEQWKIALDIAIDAVGPKGVLVVDQEGWEGIDEINQQLIHEHLVGTGVVLYTAQCDAGDLRAA